MSSISINSTFYESSVCRRLARAAAIMRQLLRNPSQRPGRRSLTATKKNRSKQNPSSLCSGPGPERQGPDHILGRCLAVLRVP